MFIFANIQNNGVASNHLSENKISKFQVLRYGKFMIKVALFKYKTITFGSRKLKVS